MTILITIFGGFLAGLLFIGVRLGRQIGFLGYLLGGVTGATASVFAGTLALYYLHLVLPY